MAPEELVQLVGTGNRATVESAWMGVVERAGESPAKLAKYEAVLREMVRADRGDEAATLAWTAIEAVAERNSPTETLAVAGPFLLAVGDGGDLRAQVTDLYRAAYGDREGLESLITEAGLPSGRPVRRALRTLDVCLAVDAGDYLAARDENTAARVDAIDRDRWSFTITSADGSEKLGAVHLADRFEPASASSYRVMRQFAADDWIARLKDDPGSVVVDICRQNGGEIDTDGLQAMLSPDLGDENSWKKWWSRARTALKRTGNIQLDGRAPIRITLLDHAVAHEDRLLAEFKKLHDPVAQLRMVEAYLRDSSARGESADAAALRSCYDAIVHRAQSKRAASPGSRAVRWLAARRVGELTGADNAAIGAIEVMRSIPSLEPVFGAIDDDSLYRAACETLIEARPDDWTDRLIEVWSTVPMGLCDWAVETLLGAGRSLDDLSPLLQRALAAPVDHFETVLWLWNGPANASLRDGISDVSVLSRILRALEDSRRSERIGREQGKRIAQRARAVLSARKYERFAAFLTTIEPDMARTIRRRIDQLDNLGRAVREDALRLMDRRFPPIEPKRAAAAWEREDVLFVTEAGMARKHAEIEHHVNVKMRDNARAIGAAAEKGDLSENSEYKFALEERDLLRARLAGMNAEMAIAKVIAPDDVPTDRIGVGTRAVFRRVEDGERYEMTFVGPWDTGAAGTLNYKAPLAQTLMGKRIGEQFDFEHGDASGRYELVELHNALREETPTL